MKDIIVRARPAAVAAVGALPFVVAIGAMALQPRTTGGLTVFALAIYSGILLVLLWSWIVGLALNQRLPPQRRPKTIVFRVAVLYVALYTAFFVATSVPGFASGMLATRPVAFAVLHLLAMIASAAMLHFVGSNLALVEGEPAGSTWSTWSTTFSLFSIGGILPVQQRVNRIFSTEPADTI